MAAWRYPLSLLVLNNISLVHCAYSGNIFQHLREISYLCVAISYPLFIKSFFIFLVIEPPKASQEGKCFKCTSEENSVRKIALRYVSDERRASDTLIVF